MLRIIDENQVHELKLGVAVIKYRKVTSGCCVMFEIAATVRGSIDALLYEVEEWRHVLAGWDGIVDAAGNEIEYSPEAAAYVEEVVGDDGPKMRLRGVGPGLPPEISRVIKSKAREPLIALVDEAKNSEASSSSDSADEGTPS